MAVEAQALLEMWYERFRGANGQEPDRYVVCAGLAVLEAARGQFPLAATDYKTEKNQVKTGGPFIQRILARYGETRPYASEGGRTTRGTVPAADALAGDLNSEQVWTTSSVEERVQSIDRLQAWLVEKARDYFNQQRIKLEIDVRQPAAQIVAGILESAGNKGGAVAQHLVGAKLALRFGHLGIAIENHSYTTADAQLGRPGDFTVRDAVFHVTVAPAPPVIEKCRANLRNGLKAYLLVPESKILAARQLASVANLENLIGLHSSIEAFVGQNIDEIGEYDESKFREKLSELFSEYNSRVSEVETDRSLLFEIPEFLQ